MQQTCSLLKQDFKVKNPFLVTLGLFTSHKLLFNDLWLNIRGQKRSRNPGRGVKIFGAAFLFCSLSVFTRKYTDRQISIYGLTSVDDQDALVEKVLAESHIASSSPETYDNFILLRIDIKNRTLLRSSIATLRRLLDLSDLEGVSIMTLDDPALSKVPHVTFVKGLRQHRIEFPRKYYHAFGTFASQCQEFFEPLSEDLKVEDEGKKLTFKTFSETVSNGPSLVFLSEPNCYMCALSLPFLNSLRSSLTGLSVFQFDLSKNDFPDKCPIIRSTPEYLVYGVSQEESSPLSFPSLDPSSIVTSCIPEVLTKLKSGNICVKKTVELPVKFEERKQLLNRFIDESKKLYEIQHRKSVNSSKKHEESFERNWDSELTKLLSKEYRKAQNEDLSQSNERLKKSLGKLGQDILFCNQCSR